MVVFTICAVILLILLFATLIKYEKSDEYKKRYLSEKTDCINNNFILDFEKQKKINDIVNMYKKM